MSERRRPNNRRGGRGRGGGRGRSGRGRGGGGRSQDYTWTSGGGGGGGGNAPQGQWTAGADDYVEPEEFPLETQSGLLFGLSDQVVVPGSVNQGLLQGEILETLKRLPANIVNLMLAHFDKCAREGGIRNKSAYLLGIINSGPRMGLPSGVVVPASVKFSLMQGVVLEDLTVLPVPLINTILGEFDTEIRQRGSTVTDRYSFLAEIIRKHKKNMPAASTSMPQQPPRNHGGHSNGTTHAPSNNHSVAAAETVTSTDVPSNNNNNKTGDEMEDTLKLLANSMKRVQLLTDSVAKVTAELVTEKEKRSSLEAIAKSEQVLREATEQSLQTALQELEQLRELRAQETTEYQTSLKFEKDRRVSIDREITELKETVKMERAEKHRAEDRLSALEEMLIAERDVRDIQRNGADALRDINSADFDSDCESK